MITFSNCYLFIYLGTINDRFFDSSQLRLCRSTYDPYRITSALIRIKFFKCTIYILLPRVCLRKLGLCWGLLLLLFLPGRWVFFGAFVSGFFILATMFVAIVMAQKLAPQGRSMVASLIQGLAYGIAGILAPLTGMVADYLTIQPVLVGAALVPLLSLVLVRRLPRVEGR